MEMVRGAWVQDPNTGRLVPREQYQRRQAQAREASCLRSALPAPQIMRDIEPFRNVAVDGAVISSRSEKREMMRRHNLVEVGTEKKITQRQHTRKTSVKESLKRSYQELGAPL